jgi:hypothetical protein
MLRFAVFCASFSLCVSAISADEPKLATRPISEADSVLAVYWEDWGLASAGDPAIILVAWPDGHIIKSGNRLKGGPPYRSCRIDAKKVTQLLARFDKEGLFAQEEIKQSHAVIDGQFISILIKSGKREVHMASSHELFTESDEIDHNGARLERRCLLDVLRQAPADYLFYRVVWSETRARMADLVPDATLPVAGKPVMKAGVLTWQGPERQRTNTR